MSVRGQLNSFIAGDRNSLEFKTDSLSPSTIKLTYFDGQFSVTISILGPNKYEASSDDDDMSILLPTTNSLCSSGKSVPLMTFLDHMTQEYYFKYIMTPSTTRRTNVEIFGEFDSEDDSDSDVEVIVDPEDFAEDPEEEVDLEALRLEEARKRQELEAIEQVRKTAHNYDVAKMVGDMRRTAQGKDHYTSKAADVEFYLEIYDDGFVWNRGGELRSLSDPTHARHLAEMRRGTVPNELNPTGAREIDLHVIWKNGTFADHQAAAQDASTSSGPDTVLGASVEWHCGTCSFCNNAGSTKCTVCQNLKPIPVPPESFPYWTCSGCSLRNLMSNVVCTMCGAEKKTGRMIFSINDLISVTADQASGNEVGDGASGSGSADRVEKWTMRSVDLEEEEGEEAQPGEEGVNPAEEGQEEGGEEEVVGEEGDGEDEFVLTAQEYCLDPSLPKTRIKIRWDEGAVVQEFNCSSKIIDIFRHVATMVDYGFELALTFPRTDLFDMMDEDLESAGLLNSQLVVVKTEDIE